MTSLTLMTLAVVLLGMVGRRGYCFALALAGVTAAGAALAFGTTVVPTFYAVAVGAVVALGFEAVRRPDALPGRLPGLPPVTPLLIAFLLWAVGVTLISPFLFDGKFTQVPPAGLTRLTAGVLTTSNVAQLGYLAIGVCVVIFVGRSPLAGPSLIGTVVGTMTVLSLWRYLNQTVGVPFPEGLFDNSPTLVFIETAPGGVERFRGILSEPAGLASFCLVTIAYMVSRAPLVGGRRRVGAVLLAGVAAYLGSISTSATFVVAAIALALIAVLTFTVRLILRRAEVSALVSVVACALVVVGLFLLPVVANIVQATVDEKVSSDSFDDRSSADSTSYNLFVDTFGIGVGLGSNRASSFFPGLLSTTGLVGTLIFAVAVAGLVRQGTAIREYRPVAWGLVALLVVKVISGPDLSDTSGILWLSLGLLSRAAAARRALPGEPLPVEWRPRREIHG